MFQHKWSRKSVGCHLEWLTMPQNDPSNFMFRTDVDCIKYLPIEESFNLLRKWLQFQFVEEWEIVVQNIFDWLTRKNFKQGGLEVVGEPNCGKSYFFGALVDLFMSIGYVRPNAGYSFNFDDCVDKRVVLCEEFFMERSDHHTIETLKDILSGNAVTVKIKNPKPATLKPVSWMFLSNHKNFPDDDPANPWTARLYRLDVRVYEEWDASTHEYRLHPYSWVKLFESFNLT